MSDSYAFGGQPRSVPDPDGDAYDEMIRRNVEHGRVHEPYTVNGTKLPQFNAVQRAWYGAPDWFKALNLSIPGHAGLATGTALNDQD